MRIVRKAGFVSSAGDFIFPWLSWKVDWFDWGFVVVALDQGRASWSHPAPAGLRLLWSQLSWTSEFLRSWLPRVVAPHKPHLLPFQRKPFSFFSLRTVLTQPGRDLCPCSRGWKDRNTAELLRSSVGLRTIALSTVSVWARGANLPQKFLLKHEEQSRCVKLLGTLATGHSIQSGY